MSRTIWKVGQSLQVDLFIDSSHDLLHQPLAVLLHPYAPLGGCAEHLLLVELSRALNRVWPTATILRPNMRGAGKTKPSQTSWTSRPEQEDLKCLLLAAHERYQPKFMLLVGYSYGALVLASLLENWSSIPFSYSVVLLSYPASVSFWLSLGHSSSHWWQSNPDSKEQTPRALIYGTRDQFTSPSVYSKCQDATNWIKIIENGDHFWMESQAVIEAILEYISVHKRTLSD